MLPYPGVLRGLGRALAFAVPSSVLLTCSRMDVGTPLSCARENEPVVADRRVAPDGTEFLVTQVLNRGGEPYTVWFNVKPPGNAWRRFFLGNAPFWIGRIELRPSEKVAIARYETEVVYDWARETLLPHDDWYADGRESAMDGPDPFFVRERR
jgi:hypothetical protein